MRAVAYVLTTVLLVDRAGPLAAAVLCAVYLVLEIALKCKAVDLFLLIAARIDHAAAVKAVAYALTTVLAVNSRWPLIATVLWGVYLLLCWRRRRDIDHAEMKAVAYALTAAAVWSVYFCRDEHKAFLDSCYGTRPAATEDDGEEGAIHWSAGLPCFVVFYAGHLMLCLAHRHSPLARRLAAEAVAAHAFRVAVYLWLVLPSGLQMEAVACGTRKAISGHTHMNTFHLLFCARALYLDRSAAAGSSESDRRARMCGRGLTVLAALLWLRFTLATYTEGYHTPRHMVYGAAAVSTRPHRPPAHRLGVQRLVWTEGGLCCGQRCPGKATAADASVLHPQGVVTLLFFDDLANACSDAGFVSWGAAGGSHAGDGEAKPKAT